MLRFGRSAKIAAIAFLIAGVAAIGLFQLSRAKCFQLVGEVTCRVQTDERLVALTFDDGPTDRGVDAVMQALARHDAKATFFLIGNAIERNPEAVRQLVSAGHEIGNHSYSHVPNVGRPQAFYREEVERTNAALRSLGVTPRYFRPPYGIRLIGLSRAVSEAGLHTVMYDVAEPDGSKDSAEDYAANILREIRPGSIVLIHAMNSHNRNARDALPLILEGLAKRGYRAVTVTRLLEAGGKAVTPDAGPSSSR
ncbi:polysaccharide deacetylase [Erythrobacter litoralis]|uniref:polysaccharide deacetylase family protein n=1 Tax=Erythrobacter litoralis TaxID=39960 RepID=UPI002434AA19|nr:polysaccharide deacetylase family protein [Erythrobacter litoralis]MDG6078026.1 polysaccharide deacetylase [Erythrobacter litoralis]